MSQHDFNIANQTFPSFRSDLNDALVAAATMSAGASAPTTPYAYQLWFDTTTGTWKVRNSGNTAWISTITTDLATGSVGIGTVSPDEKVTSSNGFLSIGAVSTTARDGAIVDYSGSTSRFIAGRSGGNYGQWEAYVAGASGVTKRYQIDYDSTTHWYAANGTTKNMSITSTGNVTIGTSVSNPHKLFIADGGNRSQADAQMSLNGAGYSAYHFLDGTAYYIGQNSNSRAIRIYSGSNTGVGVLLSPFGTSWGSFSDERLKTDIEPIENGVDKLSNLRCVSYRLTSTQTDDEGNPTQKKLGLIAQDLEGVIDEVIDRNRLNDEDETEFLSVRYTEVIPVLVKAIQEQQETITSLEARITALEAS